MSDQVEEIYARIAQIPPEERLRLAAKILTALAGLNAESVEKPKRNIMELHGLGTELWQGIEAQKYVSKLRKEWNYR